MYIIFALYDGVAGFRQIVQFLAFYVYCIKTSRSSKRRLGIDRLQYLHSDRKRVECSVCKSSDNQNLLLRGGKQVVYCKIYRI